MGDVLTTREVAQELGVSVQRVRQYADAGLLSFRRTPGGHRRFQRAALREAAGRIRGRQRAGFEPLLERVREAVHQVEPRARVILFGSRARGDARRWSDWDFLVVLEGEVTPDRRTAVWNRLTDLSIETEGCPSLSAIILGAGDLESRRDRPGVVRNALREGIEL